MRRCFSRQPRSMRHAVHAPLFLTPAPFHAARRPAPSLRFCLHSATLFSLYATRRPAPSLPRQKSSFPCAVPPHLSPIRITKKGAQFSAPLSATRRFSRHFPHRFCTACLSFNPAAASGEIRHPETCSRQASEFSRPLTLICAWLPASLPAPWFPVLPSR